jgi:integrase
MPNHRQARIGVAQVNALKAGEILRDTEVKGFGIRRREGQPSYFLQTRVKGRLRWLTIGKHGSPWTPTTAREEAIRLLRAIAAGADPGIEKRQALQANTVAEAASLFMSRHGSHLAAQTRRDYQRLFDTAILPAFGSRRVHDISAGEVERFHAGMAQTPRQANLALAVLSKLMNWLETQKLREKHSNPCVDIKRFKENHRERFLRQEELDRLGAVLTQAEAEGENLYMIAAIRLLILTGARLSEILTLKWSFIDFERGLIFLPNSKTGAKPIFLNGAAIAVLRAIPRIEDNPYVIVGASPGSHLVNLQKGWTRLRRQAGLDDLRLHDLRHSFASFAAAQGASLPMIGKLLGHSQAQTTQRYAHLVADPLRNVAETVGAHLAPALGSSPSRQPSIEPKGKGA